MNTKCCLLEFLSLIIACLLFLSFTSILTRIYVVVVRMRRYNSASSGSADKARRKTATTEELLYAAASTSSAVGDQDGGGGEQSTNASLKSGPYGKNDVTETLRPIAESLLSFLRGCFSFWVFC